MPRGCHANHARASAQHRWKPGSRPGTTGHVKVRVGKGHPLANETGATRLLILGIDDKGRFACTTFGRTRAQCRALAKWADENARMIAADMDAST